jgi:uncharacterized protein
VKPIERSDAVKELVEYLVKSLAEHPDEVVLNEAETEDGVSLELRISPEDLGRIIGKNGNTVNAIRTVLQAAASSHKKRAKLEVLT